MQRIVELVNVYDNQNILFDRKTDCLKPSRLNVEHMPQVQINLNICMALTYHTNSIKDTKKKEIKNHVLYDIKFTSHTLREIYTDSLITSHCQISIRERK